VTCSFEGCGRKAVAKGLCPGHWKQQREGKSLAPLLWRRPNGSAPVIEYDPVPCDALGTPCHVFRGSKSRGGYGKVFHDGKLVPVHRYTWEAANGPIPADMVIDHKCRVRACCNPLHLRVVTRQVNVTENVVGAMWQRAQERQHCTRGHALTADNVYRTKAGGRRCKTCVDAQNKAARTRHCK
jgi:HNH endonuclease